MPGNQAVGRQRQYIVILTILALHISHITSTGKFENIDSSDSEEWS
jgi:hypothetical protein